VFGDETQQKLEAIKNIRAYWRKQGLTKDNLSKWDSQFQLGVA